MTIAYLKQQFQECQQLIGGAYLTCQSVSTFLREVIPILEGIQVGKV